MKDVDLMVRLTKSVIKGTNLPVTVKTRLGWDESSINIDEVAERLQDIGVQALTVHARTRAQMYKGHSDWSHIQRVKENPRITMPIFGNGDIDSPEKALEYKNKYGLDGMMIGRAAIGYPWIFNEIKHYFKNRRKIATTYYERPCRSRKKSFNLVYGMERRTCGNCRNAPSLHQLFLKVFQTLKHID